MIGKSDNGSIVVENHHQKYIERDSFLGYLLSFSMKHAVKYLKGTRCKPWDNRELDVLDGFKCVFFILCTISQTAVSLFYTQTIDVFQLIGLMQNIAVTMFISSNLANECFFMVSAFLTAYKCFQIMESRDGILTGKDLLKIYLRKFFRLAPAYYGMWMILWVLTPRTGYGPIWHISDMNFQTCSDTWAPTLFFIGNLSPANMDPYSGCFSFAWPLQVDFQITLFIPLLCMLYFKIPKLGLIVSIILVLVNGIILMHLAEVNGFKIGMLSVKNYYFF